MADEKDKKSEDKQLAIMSKSIVESYIFAMGHQDLSIYSERLLMLLVKAAQFQIRGLNFKDGTALRQVSIGPLGEATIEIDAKDLLNGTGNNNYTKAKESVLELLKKTVSHERPAIRRGVPLLDENGYQVYEFEAHTLLNDVYINRKPGIIEVVVNKSTWEAILDFSKGFRSYDLTVALKFSRTYSLRIFKIISNQKYPISFTIQELREQWGLTEKYKSTSDFIKNTIDSAKEELDSMSPWTFDYAPVYSTSSDQNKGRRGRRSVTSITFFPRHQVQYESTSSIATLVSPTDMLGRRIVDRLVKNLSFTMSEIKANLVLLNCARKYFDLEEFLIKITPTANRATIPQGYVVNAVKAHLREKHNVVVSKTGIVKKEK